MTLARLSRGLWRTVVRPWPAAAVAAAQCRRQSSAAEPKPFSAIPGPKGLPVLGSLLDLRRNTKQLHVFVDDHLKKYGDIVKLKLPGIGHTYNIIL